MNIGQKIKILEYEKEGHRKIKTTKIYTIMKYYPHIILCENKKTGIRRCLSVGDMMVMGLIKQEPELEALKMEDGKIRPKWA